MNLSRTTKVNPNKLSKSGRVVVFQRLRIAKSFKNRITPHETLVQTRLFGCRVFRVVAWTVFYTHNRGKVLDNCRE